MLFFIACLEEHIFELAELETHHCCPTAHLVSCTRHVKDNAIRQLQDIVDCESKTLNYLISKVFGEDGLMAAEDVADLETAEQSPYLANSRHSRRPQS